MINVASGFRFVPDEWNRCQKGMDLVVEMLALDERLGKCERQDDGMRSIYIDSVSLIYCKAYKCTHSTIDHRSPAIDQTCIDRRQR